MKKTISVILVLVILCASLPASVQAAQPDEITPRYVTTNDARTRLSINSAGNATVCISFLGDAGVTEVSVTTYLEQLIGSTWYRARVNPWSYSANGSCCAATFSGHVNNSGTYRARSIFTISGTTIETFTVISECTY